MSNQSRLTENNNPGRDSNIQSSQAGAKEPVQAEAAKSGGKDLIYPDMQSAMRFPIRLPISVKSKSGESRTESQNISANGVLFEMDVDMPVGSMVDFTISLPSQVVGSGADVQLDCRGRVVRSSEEGGRRGVGVVIDEYRFERR